MQRNSVPPTPNLQLKVFAHLRLFNARERHMLVVWYGMVWYIRLYYVYLYSATVKNVSNALNFSFQLKTGHDKFT